MLALFACGRDESSASPPPLSTASTRRADAGPPPATDADVLVPTGTAKTYGGSLSATDAVSFGGDGYCNYSMTLKDVAMEMFIVESGDVAKATVTNVAVEAALDGCPYPAMAPSSQSYALASSEVTTTGTRLTFAGADANQPKTELVVDLASAAGGADAWDATMTWHRTDQGPPLDWRVIAKVSLVRR